MVWMKRITRAGGLFLALALALLLAACGGQPQGGQAQDGGQQPAAGSGKSLYSHGLDVVSLMAEMARSEDYIALHTDADEVRAVLEDAGRGDFTAPKAVYCLTVPASAFLTLAGEETGVDLSGLSPALRRTVEGKLPSALIAQLNAQAGMAAIAAAGVCTAGKSFVSSELDENVIYLYTFENAVPAAVSFIPGENGAVSASGILVLNSAVSEETLQMLEQYREELGITVEEITP